MKAFLTFSLLLLIIESQAQIISGRVATKKNVPVAGASVSIINSYDGAIADSMGNFSFTHEISKGDTLEVTATNFEPFTLALQPGKSYQLVGINLTELISELQAVTVRSVGAFIAGTGKKGVVMSALDIVTTSQNGDITTALKFLPGAQQVGEQEGLFVRGGSGNETKQYMDGAIISNPFFKGAENYAQRGRYNPFLFSGTLFSTGGYSVLYGDALSSVVLLNSVGLPERSEISLSVSPIGLQAGTQRISKNKDFSWGSSYGITAVAPYFKILKPGPEFYNGPTYHTADGNFRAKTKNGMIRFFVQFNNNHLGMRTPNIDSAHYKDQVSVENNNFYSNLNWQENLRKNWKLSWSNSFSINKDDIAGRVVDAGLNQKFFQPDEFWMNAKNFSVDNNENNLQTRLVLEKKLKNLNTFRIGTEYNYFIAHMRYQQNPYSLKYNSEAAFTEVDKYFSNNFAITLGARSEYTSVIKKMNFAPRLSAVYRVSAGHQLSAAYGWFYQKPDAIYLIRNQNMDYSKAIHYLLNYTIAVTDRLLRMEIYYKDYKKLIKTIPVVFGNLTYNNNAQGYAKGIDVFWKDRKTISLFEYWLSYSYLDTKRDYLNYTSMLRPHYATPHTASLVLKKFILPIKTQLNLTYSYATGRPYYYFQQTAAGFVKKDEGKTMSYNNVGFSVNYVPFIGKENNKIHPLVVLSISNLLNSKQIYGYNYSYDGRVKQPVLPGSRQFFYLGFFLNIGTDRRQQIINDNL